MLTFVFEVLPDGLISLPRSTFVCSCYPCVQFSQWQKCFTCCVLVFFLHYVWSSFTGDLIHLHIVMLSALFQTIEALSSIPSPELALRLYLHCAEVCHIYILGRVWFAGSCCLNCVECIYPVLMLIISISRKP